MRRSALLHCANCSKSLFDTLRARDLLPFFVWTDAGSKWQEFTLHDCFLLRLALDLMGSDMAGEYSMLSAKAASFVVGNASMGMREEDQSRLLEGTDIWIGCVLGSEFCGDFDDPIATPKWFAGDLDAIGEAIRDHETAEKHEAWISSSLFLANASNADRYVRRRAEELGLTVEQCYPKRAGA